MTEPAPSVPAPVTRPAIERLLDADWRAVGAAALPVLLALFVGAQVAALSLWLAGGDTPLEGGLGVVNYLTVLALLSCAAFFGSLTASAETNSDGFNPSFTVHAVPLGITALVLITAWFAIKRSAQGDRRTRMEFAARVSAVVALVVLVLALASRVTAGDGGDRGTLHANVLESVFGSLILMLAVTLLAARGDEPWLAARLGSWAAPVRGAISGLGAALVLGFLAGLVAVVITVQSEGGSLVDVLRALPLAIVFLPTLGLAVAHVALLGTLDASVTAFFGAGGGVGLLERHGLSAWYWLLVVIAPVIIAIAIIRALRSAGEVDDAGARRVALRVALPLTLGWVLLTLVTRIRAGAFGFNSSVGPTFWQAIVLPAAWASVLGFFLAGPLRRFATRPAVLRAPRAPIPLSTLCLGFVVASVLLAAGAAAGAQQKGGFGPFSLGESETTSATAVYEGGAGGTLTPEGFTLDTAADLEMLAEQVRKSEREYYDEHNRYTAESEPLRPYGFHLPPAVQWSATAAGTRCASC